MDLKIRDSYFKEAVKTIKDLGFDVYVPEHIFKGSFRFGYVTDGTHILYFEVSEFGDLNWGTVHIPSLDGDGVLVTVPTITKENILRTFNVSYGKPYADFEHFRKSREKWCNFIKL